jgi:hypothetical protein
MTPQPTPTDTKLQSSYTNLLGNSLYLQAHSFLELIVNSHRFFTSCTDGFEVPFITRAFLSFCNKCADSEMIILTPLSSLSILKQSDNLDTALLAFAQVIVLSVVRSEPNYNPYASPCFTHRVKQRAEALANFSCMSPLSHHRLKLCWLAFSWSW